MIIKNVKDFDLEQTIECGQCFHFDKIDENDYIVVAYSRLLHISQVGNDLYFHDKDEDEVNNIWIPFFDLDRDYEKIKRELIKIDHVLKKPILEKYGVRIMNQEFYEMVISFIISQNKQIPQIKKIVFDLSEKYGNYLGEINEKKYYSFPDKQTLFNITEEDFRSLKTGFRAPYLKNASRQIMVWNEEEFRNMNYNEAKRKLIEVKGIGEKVANCILLFGLGFRNAFPVDVWIKRVMEVLYFEGKDIKKEEIQKYGEEKYGILGGYAQQYLFYYGRSNNVK